jgi:hypothetical protein
MTAPAKPPVLYESIAGKAMRQVCEQHREGCPDALWSNCGGHHMEWLGCNTKAYDPMPTRDEQHPERCPYASPPAPAGRRP